MAMKVLVTNDDGVFAEEMWTLVRELKKIAQVVVVAPDREQSAIGTAVTLSRPLRIRAVRPVVPEVEAYSVEGTPADSVILALEKLITDRIDLVISGINQGMNLGNDVLISGTVGAALQGYLRGFSALAVSVSLDNNQYRDDAAKVVALLAEKICSSPLSANIFLNINLPNLPLAQFKGVKTTRLAGGSHIDTVEEGHDGKREYYWLVRQKLDRNHEDRTDIGTVEQGNISATPLHIYLNGRSSPPITDSFFAGILEELQQSER